MSFAQNALDNAITVTSTLPNDRLADVSNFSIAVDIGLPAENLVATGVNAHQRIMPKSSFAVAKLAAYVICMVNAMTPNRLGKTRLRPATSATGYGLFPSNIERDVTRGPYRQDAMAKTND